VERKSIKEELRACVICHCEKSRLHRDDEAISEGLDCFASLAMTKEWLLTHPLREQQERLVNAE